MLAQLLSLIPRHVFTQVEREFPSERKARVFSRWNQFVCLAFIHIAARHSMRDGLRNLAVNARKLYHLGAKPVARSTFADANSNRPAAFFQALFGAVYKQCQAIAPSHKFRFKNKLFSLDASTVKLSLDQFPWASFRENRGGIKLHALLDHDGYIPSFLEISNARKHESKVAQALTLPKGSIVVFDRGYVCYRWFAALMEAGVFFVTRQKKNMSYKVLKRRPVNKKQGITSDQIIQVMSGGKPLKLRRVGYRDAKTGEHFVYLTSHFSLAARSVAEIYKERWQIEIFFRLIKQNLKIKRFIGTSENAVLS
ncbi:IS4 family transposase [Pseudodesulfovibrio thermohalotolerans]|uniref:IS4 family transposase n=1 Tax=Pseudodesulfovibrio thermohalotolerans TaxID=2880651 RepID=UPI0022B9DB47|nr:IS4 family transposase [Pseudodesulfovibrio thermohalotolerans]WFS64340.1 IS4 family transposase [Pseudodesulfovibrio thermohalotolerans]